VPFILPGKPLMQGLADDEVNQCVAQKFEAFIRLQMLVRLPA
jgi:hypothetical protein